MGVVDYYAVLGLAPGVPITQVKARFRFLAMAVHPDRNADDAECQERLKHINAAYEFLSDATRKSEYDARIPVRSFSPARPAPVRAVSSIFRVPRLLTAVVACTFLAGVVAAAVALVESAQSADNPIPVPVMMIIELPSDERQVPPPRESGMTFASPVAVAPAEPIGNGTLWPGDLSSSGTASPAPGGIAPATEMPSSAAGAGPAPNFLDH